MQANPKADIVASHTISIDLPVQQCQRLFTPAGETHWVEGWQPRYLHPADGRTEAGMLFITGDGAETTTWVLQTYTQAPYRARYARVTPASRWGFVEVECRSSGEQTTQVQVTYEMHALTPEANAVLKGFEPEPFAAMIDGWKACIDRQLETLRHLTIR